MGSRKWNHMEYFGSEMGRDINWQKEASKIEILEEHTKPEEIHTLSKWVESRVERQEFNSYHIAFERSRKILRFLNVLFAR